MGRRIQRLLLLAYPADLRREFGDEVGEVFAQRLRAARRVGPMAILRLLWRETTDSLRTGLRFRLSGSQLPHQQPKQSPTERVSAMLDSLAHDLRDGLRAFRSAPGFAFAAVAVLAVAIGANTAMFSVLDAVLLRPLPFAEPERLMALFEVDPARGWSQAQASAANYLDWRERATSFDDIAAHNDWLLERTRLHDGQPTVVNVNEVTGNFFSVLGAVPGLGRGFDPADDWQGGERKVVISHAYWSETLGGDPEVIGTALTLDGDQHTIVGVAPKRFRFPFPEVDAWVPVAWDPESRGKLFFRRAHGMRPVGRLANGASEQEAVAELRGIAAQLETEYPEINAGLSAGFVPLHEWIVGDSRDSLLLAFVAVALVLVIACVNVANLQLARAADRSGEMALRQALGAGRMRLTRLNLAESLMLAFVGGLLGLGTAALLVRLLLALLPDDFPRLGEVGLDPRVLLFTLAAVVITGIAFGMAPSLRAAADRPGRSLRGDRSTGDRRVGRSAALLVAIEVALVLPVAIGAVLMFRTVAHMQQIDPGFDPDDTVVLGISLPRTQYDTDARAAFFASLLAQVRAQSGVEAAAVSTRLPFVNQRWSSGFRAESWGPDESGIDVRHDEISTGLFETMRVDFIEGRDFDPAELADEPVAIVNRALAEQYFPERGPVGDRLCFERVAEDCRYWYRVVGVVENVRRVSLTEQEAPSIYGSLPQNGSASGFMLVRSALPTADVVDLVSAEMRELDPALPFHTVTTMRQVVGESVSRERLLLGLFGIFASIAALLAAFGVYSVVAYSTARRTREIGIRSSLGARPADLLGSVVARGMLPVALGVVAGVGLAFALAGAFRSFVVGVGVHDPLSYGAVALGLIVVALLACVVPGRRVLRVDPVVALRSE